MTFESQLNKYQSPYFTDSELEFLLAGTPHSRYGKIKRALAKGVIVRIRRGLYCLAAQKTQLEIYEIAQRIYGPSYISLESALSYHQLIPEAVHTITSACAKRTKEFHTPLGVFHYAHLPEEEFFVQVSRIETEKTKFFIAKPWKAICDYVYVYKKDWESIEPLVNSLRMESEELPPISSEEVEELKAYYQNKRMTKFLRGVNK